MEQLTNKRDFFEKVSLKKTHDLRSKITHPEYHP